MKILFIGAGASGVVGAILYKRNHLNDEVLIIEHLDKPLKKILATGNGKCNFSNENLDVSKYKNSSFVKPIIKEFGYKEAIEFFKSIGVIAKSVDGLVYPISESAVTVRDALLEECKILNIKINVNENLIDYKVSKKFITVLTDKQKYVVDKLVLASGGLSSPKLGSDGSTLKVLESHGYAISEPQPALCPIYTKEDTSILDGTRVKCIASLFKDDQKIFEESGEVLFKDHGLSGIVIFNLSRQIENNPKSKYIIKLGLLPTYKLSELKNYCKTHTYNGFLRAFLHPKMVSYFTKKGYINSKACEAAKELAFNFKKLYDFEFSQVTVGGIKINELTPNLESKKEKNVFVIGELVDVDGPCGGYNLMWAFASANKVK